MVRIKHRYLLLNILYPDLLPLQTSPPAPPSAKPQNPTTSTTSRTNNHATLPSVVQFRQPTPDDITPQILSRAIKDQIALLYGDYGVGVTAASFSGRLEGYFSLLLDLEEWGDGAVACSCVYG